MSVKEKTDIYCINISHFKKHIRENIVITIKNYVHIKFLEDVIKLFVNAEGHCLCTVSDIINKNKINFMFTYKIIHSI